MPICYLILITYYLKASFGSHLPSRIWGCLYQTDKSVWYEPHPCMNNAAAAKSLQSCPTLCDPIDGSPPGFPAPGILQARTLEWVAIYLSNAWKWEVKVKSLSHVRLLATPWTAAHQTPLSMDFPGKNTGVGCHCLLLAMYTYIKSSQCILWISYNFNCQLYFIRTYCVAQGTLFKSL